MDYDKRKLPVDLKDEELNNRRDDLAKANLDHARLISEKSTASSGFNQRIKEVKTRIADLAQQISSRQEYREVEVEERRNEEKFTIETVRLDSEQVVESRAMTTAERQMTLPNIQQQRARRRPATAGE